MKPTVIYIVGPTATGKTAVSIELAKRIDGEIINADSMQIYKGMDIGTAKPTHEHMQGIKHHMIDIVDPCAPYSVSLYKMDASACIRDIINRGKMPIVVGGTGLYIRSLTHEMDFFSAYGGGETRAGLEEELASRGAEYMHERLSIVDPETAQRLHANDTRRVIRALEIFELTGSPMGAVKNGMKVNAEWEHLLFGISIQRNILYERIDFRVEQMIRDGLIEEAKFLLNAGVSPNAQSMQGIGYKQCVELIINKTCNNLADTIKKIKLSTRHLAKRQITWFNKDDICWLEMGSKCTTEQTAISIIKSIYQ